MAENVNVDYLIDLLKAIYAVKVEFIEILETEETDFDKFPTLITNYLVDKYNEGYIAGYEAGWQHFFPGESTDAEGVLDHVEYTPQTYAYSGEYDYDELVDLMRDALSIRLRIKTVINTESNFWPDYPDILLALAQERYQDGFDDGYEVGYGDAELVHIDAPAVDCFNNIVTITSEVDDDADAVTYYAVTTSIAHVPSENDYQVYTSPIEISRNVTVWAYTTRGNRESNTVSKDCSFVSILAPTIDNYYGEITLSAQEGTTIYYWITSGEEELQSLTQYYSPFLINQTCTVHTYCTLHSQQSATNTQLCEYEDVHVEAPIIIPGNGLIYMKCQTTGVTIRYTLDGSLPTRSSSAYSGPVQCTEWTSYTIKAIAYKGAASSEISTYSYTYYDSDHNHLTYRALGNATVYIGKLTSDPYFVAYTVLSNTNPRRYAYKVVDELHYYAPYDLFVDDYYFDDHDPCVVELSAGEELIFNWFPSEGLRKNIKVQGSTSWDYTCFENEANLRCYGSIYENSISHVRYHEIIGGDETYINPPHYYPADTCGIMYSSFLLPQLSGKSITMYRRPDCHFDIASTLDGITIGRNWGASGYANALLPWKITDTIKWARDVNIDRDFGPNSGRTKYYNFSNSTSLSLFYANGDPSQHYYSAWDSDGNYIGINSILTNITTNCIPQDEEISLYGMFAGCTSITDASNAVITPSTSSFLYGQFSEMFTGCTSLVTAPALNAMTINQQCYQKMFFGCTSLVNAPALPATTIQVACYKNMFTGCTSLVNAPALPATTLAQDCYYEMFKGCTSLIVPPALRARTLVSNCYNSMFKGCSSLDYVICFATDHSASSCTQNWLSGVASVGTFIAPLEVSWSSGASGCPYGWTRKELMFVEDDRPVYYRSESADSFTIRFFCAYEQWTSTGSESWIGIPSYTGGEGWVDMTVNLTSTNSPRSGYVYIVSGSQAGGGSGETRIPVLIEQNNNFFNELTFNIINGGKLGWMGYGENGGTTGSLYRTIQYKINDGNWTNISTYTWGGNDNLFNVSTGDIVKFRGYNNYYGKANGVGNTFVYSTGTKVSISGNVMSLIDGDNFTSLTTVADYCFQYLFDGLGLGTPKAIVNCDELILPAYHLGSYCYAHMFSKSSATSYRQNLLPAVVLAPYCYYDMFGSNASLTASPKLPATTLAEGCYNGMFDNCISLVNGPDLPADKLVAYCYSSMFRQCQSLSYLKIYATKNIASGNYYNILAKGNNTQSSGTLYKMPNTTWAVDDHYIPSTWTQVDIS